MESKPRIEMPSKNTTELTFNGTSANVKIEPIHELGEIHMMKSPKKSNNKSKIEITLPTIFKLAPRDLYDENSTQDVMPGLDIIDAAVYFEYQVDLSVYILIEDNKQAFFMINEFANTTEITCRKSIKDCFHLKQFIENNVAKYVLGNINLVKEVDSFHVFD